MEVYLRTLPMVGEGGGRFYERLDGLVKSRIKKIISRARLSFDELNTAIIEIEGVLNGHPFKSRKIL